MADYVCPRPDCQFTSIGHPTKKAAQERGAEHTAEHEQTANQAEENK